MSRAPGWPAPAADLIARAAAGPVRLWQVALAALGGNLLLHQLPHLPPPALTVSLTVAALLALVLAGLRVACLPAILLLAFCGTAAVAREDLRTRWPSAADGQDVELRGWIDDLPRREPGRTVFALRVVEGDAATTDGAQAAAGASPRRVRLSWYDPAPALAAGQALAIEARLRSPHGLVNPGGFDYERWLYLEGFDATGYVREGRIVALARPSLAQRWLRFRAGLIESLGERIPDADARALVLALALGEYVGFEDRHWAAMTATGTSHLVSVSGLHIAIVAGLSFWILLRLILRLPYAVARHALVLAAGLSLIPATAYAALAGFALPTQRSLVMLLVAGILIVARRRSALGGALSLALLGVLALDPTASLTASFWLSFVAVALLLVAALTGRSGSGGAGVDTPGVSPPRGARVRALAWLAEFGRVQWALTLGLIPLGLWYFGQFSPASYGVNLVAIPLFSALVVPLSLLSACVAALGIHDPWLTPVTAELARLAWDGIELAAATPFAAIALPEPPLVEVLLASAAIALALPWHPLPGRRLLLLGLVPLFLPDGDRLPAGELRVTVLDVGQGLAVAIETRSHRALYDAGPLSRSGFDAGAEIVGPALDALGARHLDRLILSHADADHAGGVGAILLRHPEATLLAGPDVSYPAARPCRAGDRWVWDLVSFSILHPGDDFGPPGNETSCVLRIDTAHGSILLTGDIERRAEAELARAADIGADVVVVPHHGSRTSSTAGFVETVSPQLAIVSAGHNNRWGFPLPEIRDRWEAAGARLLVTADSGAVDVRFSDSGITVSEARWRRRRYWHAGSGPVSGAGAVSAL
jgi:competence protein ComEC